MLVNLFIISVAVITYTWLWLANISLAIFIFFFVGVIQALTHTPFHLLVGPLHIYSGDIFFVSCLISFFILLFERGKLPGPIPLEVKLLCIYACIMGVHVIMGWHHFQTAAIINSRGILITLGIMLALGIRPTTGEEYEKIFISILIVSILYMFIAYLRWFDVIGKTEFVTEHEGTWIGERLLNRSQAVFLAFGFILVAAGLMIKKISFNAVSIAYLFFAMLAIVLCQIRSIWIVTVFSLALLFILEKTKPSKIFVSIFCGIVFVGLIYQVVLSTGKIEFIKAAAISGIYYGEGSTFYWRNMVSAAYLDHMQPVNYLFGTTFGDLPYIAMGSSWGQWGLHNNYVEVFYYGGLIGFIAFYAVCFRLLYRLYVFRNKADESLVRLIFLFLLVTLSAYLIFFLNWTVDELSAVSIGLSISFLRDYPNALKQEQDRDNAQLRLSI